MTSTSSGQTSIKKAVIPAAGLGTRFLPATKNVPKEMLTIVDAPIILYVVEEAIEAGIEDIVLVAGRGKHAIEDFFDASFELESKLEKDNQLHLLERVLNIRRKANIISIRQKQSLGLGHAVLCSQPIIGNQPFAVLLGDEISMRKKSSENMIQILANQFNASGASTVSVVKISDEDVQKYGIAELTPIQDQLHKVKSLIEKPRADQTQSRWALTGRYVFESKIFDLLKSAKSSAQGEIQLTDSMHTLAQSKDMFAHEFVGQRFDAGDKLGYMKANIEFALQNSDIGVELKAYLKQRVKTF